MRDEKVYFFIFHQTDRCERQEQELSATNWFYCKIHIFSGIDQSADVQRRCPSFHGFLSEFRRGIKFLVFFF